MRIGHSLSGFKSNKKNKRKGDTKSGIRKRYNRIKHHPTIQKRFRKLKAQTGIGTLIVFIALVLVAAVTAAVLLRASGTLESKAKAAGEEAAKEVSTNVRFLEVSGYTYDGNSASANATGNITKLILTVQLGPGGVSIDYEGLILTYYSGDNKISFSYNSSGTSYNNISDFYVSEINSLDDSSALEKGEYAEIHIWLENENGPLPLTARDTFKISALPVGGSITDVTRTAPGGLGKRYITSWV